VDAARLENEGVLAEIHDVACSATSRTSTDTDSSANGTEQAGTDSSDSHDSLVGRCRLI
jgi:hypothetical protein